MRRCRADHGVALPRPRWRRTTAAALFVCLALGAVPAAAQTHAESLVWGPSGRYGRFTDLSGTWASLAAIDAALTASADGNTVYVSGGGDALRFAIIAAGSTGTLIEITDSATYNWVTFTNKSRVYVRAQAGQTPKILSNPALPDAVSGGNSNAVVFEGDNVDIGLQGLTFLVGANGNAETVRQPTKVGAIRYSSISGTRLQGLLIQDCRFEPLDRSLGAVVGVQLVNETGSTATHRDIGVRRTVFDSTGTVEAATDDLAAITVTDFENVLIANVHFRRTSTQSTASQMRGARVNVRNGLVEYAYCEDIGSSSGANECVYISGDTTGGSGVLDGHSVTVRNSAALSANRAFLVNLANSTLNVDHSVVVTGAATNILEAGTSTSTLNVTNSIFLQLSGTDTLLTRVLGSVFTTGYNLYRWRGALGFTQDSTDKIPGFNCDAICDPSFENALGSDFRMSASSPAIKAASDGSDMGVLFYSISPSAAGFTRLGGQGYVDVTASGAWTSSSGASWITPDSTGTPIGNGRLSYTVATNTSSTARTGVLTVAGIAHTITQGGVSCNPSLSPSTQSVVAAGASGSVSVTQSASDCTWSATSNSSWITVTSGSTGSGTLSSLSYTVAANTSSNPRSGTVTIAGLTFTVNQAGLSCNYQVTPSSALLPYTAMTGLSVQLTAAVNDCAWSSTADASWLHLTNAGSGLGSGTVTYRADANANSAERSGTLTIAGQTFTVVQQGVSCAQSLSSTGAFIAAGGGAGAAVAVTSSAPDCSWTAASNNTSWLTLTSPNSVTGSSSVTWSAAENTSSQLRTGTLTISGQTFTVNQAGRTCSFSLSSLSTPAALDAAGGTGASVGITAAASDCSWTAASNDSWITITSGSAGVGNGATAFTVASNPSSFTRSGTLTIAGITYRVTQAGRSCGYSLTPTSATMAAAGGDGVVGLSAQVSDCTWTAASNNIDWLTVSSASPVVGSSSVTYSAMPNARHAQRSGTLSVAGLTFTVTQPGVECDLTVSTTSISAGSSAVTGVVSVTSNASDCSWTLVPGASWMTLAGAATRTGSDTVSYSIAANALSASRSTIVTIAGTPIAVAQDGASCTYKLSAGSSTSTALGGTATVKLTAGATDCSWTTTSNSSWIRVDSGASRIGTGDVTMTVSSNASSSKTRVGSVTIAGLAYTVTQAGVACTSTVPKVTTPSSAAATGATLSIPVTTSPSDCDWTMTSDVAWLTPDAGSASGSGSRTLTATAAASTTSKARTGNLTVVVGSSTTKVPVSQAGLTCAYQLAATEASYDYRAAASGVGITANAPDCVWAASRGSTAWITLDATQGTGNGILTYKVLANATTVPRQATLLIGGIGYVVTQGPAPCSVSVPSTGANVAATGSSGSLSVTAASLECTWTATSNASWLTLTAPTTQQGTGSLKYTAAANTSSKPRTGTITINDKTYTLTQAGATCTYTFDPTSLTFAPAGGSAEVKIASSVTDCEWTATPTASWIQVPVATGTGPTTLAVSATANTTTKSRTGSISIGGKSVAVTQSAQGTGGQLFTRYLAEGATSAFFSTRLALLNPGSTQSNVTLRFLKSTGENVEYKTTIKPTSRLTIDPRTIVGNAEFSTEIESSTQVIVDRTMSWDGTAYGSHAETGVQFPAETWYLAEGSTAGNFDLFYLVQNPNPETATVTVQFLLPGGAPVTKRYTVGGNSRFNIWVNQIPEVARTDLSGVVTSNVPVIVERAMYLSRANIPFVGGHGSAGVNAPATEWFLAEGATGPYFDTYVLVANPTDQAALVNVSYLLPGGGSVEKAYVVDPLSRFSIWVDQEDPLLANTGVSTVVRSTNNVPVIVERAMWWPGNWTTWAEAHNSPGATTTATKWALAEGEVGGTAQSTTYVLIANTGGAAGQAKVTLMFESGTPVSKIIDLPANSRTNVNIADWFKEAANKRFGVVVESLGTKPAPIVVERAIYTSSGGVGWAAGTNALATALQ